MAVIKEPMPIPEGYTFERCDQYTKEEFLKRFKANCAFEVYKEYVEANPKEYYDTDDEIAVHNIIAGRSVPGLIHGLNRFTTKRNWYHGDQ